METNNEASTNQHTLATFTVNVIPKKVSLLENDMHYISDADIPTKVSQLENDAGYITEQDVPRNLSEYNNDVPFVVGEELPTKVSQLENDAGYITIEDIKNLSSDNFNPDLLENVNKTDYSMAEDEFKFVSENYVQSIVPYMGRTKNSESIDIEKDLYNLEEDLRSGKAIQSDLNSCITSQAKIDLNYASAGAIKFEILHPPVKDKEASKDVSYNLTIQGSGNIPYSSNSQSYLHILRRYHILRSISEGYYGLDITNYSNEYRNYIQAFTHNAIRWYIPITMYEVQLTCYSDKNARQYNKLFYTLNAGIKEEDYTEEEAYEYWQFINNKTIIPDHATTNNYTVKYTGKELKCYISLSELNDDVNFQVSTIHEMNDGYKYKEMLPTYFCNSWCQKCHLADGTVAYAYLGFTSPYNAANTPTCYENVPSIEVPINFKLYHEISLDTEVANTGNFIWDYECYRTRYAEEDKIDIAFYVYGLVNPLLDDEDPNQHYWTAVAGDQGTQYEGTAVQDFADLKPLGNPTDLSQKWYSTNKENLYVLASDITEEVTAGANVPEGTKLYYSKSIFHYSEQDADESTVFESNISTLAYEYTDEKIFLYAFEEIPGAEDYVSDDPGLYEKQEDGTLVKVDTAYQWECHETFNAISPASADDHIVFPAEQDTSQFNIDWSINGLYWWVYKAWKVVSNLSGVEAWCPFDYSLDVDKRIDILCMDAEGNMIVPPENEYWTWEGTFNPNFANRLI